MDQADFKLAIIFTTVNLNEAKQMGKASTKTTKLNIKDNLLKDLNKAKGS